MLSNTHFLTKQKINRLCICLKSGNIVYFSLKKLAVLLKETEIHTLCSVYFSHSIYPTVKGFSEQALMNHVDTTL